MLLRISLILMALLVVSCTSKSQVPEVPEVNDGVTDETRNPLTDKVTAIEAGKELFIRNCMTCHGLAGKGDGPASSSLIAIPADLTSARVTSMNDGKIFLTIKYGKKTDGKLTMGPTLNVSDTQIWEIEAYVRALK